MKKFTLLEGDPMDPQSTDLIVEQARLAVGRPVPEGWRVLTGNMNDSLIVRVAYRYEIEDEK